MLYEQQKTICSTLCLEIFLGEIAMIGFVFGCFYQRRLRCKRFSTHLSSFLIPACKVVINFDFVAF